MASHYINRCVHGTLMGQCRCPSPDKAQNTVECRPPCAYAKPKEIPKLDIKEDTTVAKPTLNKKTDDALLVCELRRYWEIRQLGTHREQVPFVRKAANRIEELSSRAPCKGTNCGTRVNKHSRECVIQYEQISGMSDPSRVVRSTE